VLTGVALVTGTLMLTDAVGRSVRRLTAGARAGGGRGRRQRRRRGRRPAAGHPARPGRRRRDHARAVPAHRAARLDLRTAIGLE
jgi:hypothetical protein